LDEVFRKLWDAENIGDKEQDYWDAYTDAAHRRNRAYNALTFQLVGKERVIRSLREQMRLAENGLKRAPDWQKEFFEKILRDAKDEIERLEGLAWN
ncbi:MAG: hypothetical protein VCE43_15790, partial [Myxococcota bacterium]